MNSRFRLQSSAFDRKDDENKVEPKRLIVLSTEGDTERRYFEHLNRHLDNSIIKIEVLRQHQSNGHSAPEQVIELLNEYTAIKDDGVIPSELPSEFIQKYDKQLIDRYLNNSTAFTKKELNRFYDELLKLGIDVEYRKYLNTSPRENDVFGIIIDRDSGNHDRQLLEDCIQLCHDKGYKFYFSNPCFEFWLLLHLCDVRLTYTDHSEIKLEALHKNEPISDTHTVTSKEVSNIAHHNKNITGPTFEKYYFPNISKAVAQAEDFATDFPELLDNPGTNIHELMNILGYHA